MNEDDENMSRLNLRDVLSLLAKIYDPLGLVTPYVVQGKILLRKTFIEKNDVKDQRRKWDNPVSFSALRPDLFVIPKHVSLEFLKLCFF